MEMCFFKCDGLPLKHRIFNSYVQSPEGESHVLTIDGSSCSQMSIILDGRIPNFINHQGLTRAKILQPT
jgi:hypothetical protein